MGDEQWFELDKRLEVIDKGSCSESHPTPLLFVHGGRLAAWCWDEIFWTSPTGAIARLLLIFADMVAAPSLNRSTVVRSLTMWTMCVRLLRTYLRRPGPAWCAAISPAPRWRWRIMLFGVPGRAGYPGGGEPVGGRGGPPRWCGAAGAGGPEFGSGDRRCDRFGVVGVRRDRGAGRDGQRMESVAPADGVMLSESTARLVDGAAALGEPEMVSIKDANEPARAWSPVRRMA